MTSLRKFYLDVFSFHFPREFANAACFFLTFLLRKEIILKT